MRCRVQLSQLASPLQGAGEITFVKANPRALKRLFEIGTLGTTRQPCQLHAEAVLLICPEIQSAAGQVSAQINRLHPNDR